MSKDPIYDFFLGRHTSINEYLDVVLPRLGFDLKTLDLTIYEGILHLFGARNNVAHKGVCQFKVRGTGTEVNVDQREARLLVENAEKFITALNTATP
jgi:hypothetical protein